MPNYYSMRTRAQGRFTKMRVQSSKGIRMVLVALLLFVALLCGCGSKDTVDEIGMSVVTFPNGKKITAEAARDDISLLRGLMFRESMAPDRGMLFTHPDESIYHYWMYKTKIPLDIIWMDHDHRIVEMSLKTPPCEAASPKDCFNYGGKFKSRFALEVNAGVAEANHLQLGDTLQF